MLISDSTIHIITGTTHEEFEGKEGEGMTGNFKGVAIKYLQKRKILKVLYYLNLRDVIAILLETGGSLLAPAHIVRLDDTHYEVIIETLREGAWPRQLYIPQHRISHGTCLNK